MDIRSYQKNVKKHDIAISTLESPRRFLLGGVNKSGFLLRESQELAGLSARIKDPIVKVHLDRSFRQTDEKRALLENRFATLGQLVKDTAQIKEAYWREKNDEARGIITEVGPRLKYGDLAKRRKSFVRMVDNIWRNSVDFFENQIYELNDAVKYLYSKREIQFVAAVASQAHYFADASEKTKLDLEKLKKEGIVKLFF